MRDWIDSLWWRICGWLSGYHPGGEEELDWAEYHQGTTIMLYLGGRLTMLTIKGIAPDGEIKLEGEVKPHEKG